MPISVNGPGGIVINFPDGTDSSVIDREMRRIVVDKESGEQLSGAQLKARTGIGEPLTADTAVRQIAKGIPVLGGAMENIAAAGDAATQPLLGRGSAAPTFSDRYGQNLERERAIDLAAEKGNPAATTALNIGGGIAATGPLAMTGLGARALGLVGTLPARMAQGAAGGGAMGAVDAWMRGQSPWGGAGLGGGLGAAAPVGGRLVGAGVERVGSVLRPMPQELQGLSRGAISKVGRAMTDDVATTARAQELGPQGMMVDLGPNLNAQGQALATQPGAASKMMADAVGGRFKAADTRIKGEVDTTLGPAGKFRETQKAAISERKKAGDELYQRAFENARPVDITPSVQYIDDTIRPGLSRLAEGGPAPDSIQGVLGRVRDVLAGGNAQRVDIRDLHVAKMDLDDMIEAAVRGGKNNQARVLINVRDRLVNSMDEATSIPSNSGELVSMYRQARTKYKSDSAVINALDEGRGLFTKATRPDDLLEKVKEMSEAERHAFQIGARDAIDEVMGNVKNDALAARTLFGKDWNQQKLTALVGKEKAQQLLQTIERENTFAQTFGDIQRGSQTRGRLAAGEEFPNKVSPTSTQFVNPSVLGIGELAIRKGLDALRMGGRQARLDQEGADAARLLTAQGADRDVFMEAVRRVRQNQQAIEPYANSARDIATILMQSPRQSIQDRLFSRH